MSPFSSSRSVIFLGLILLVAPARAAEEPAPVITPDPIAISVRSGEIAATSLTLSNPTDSQFDWRLEALDANGRAATLEGQLDAIIDSGDTLNGPLPLRFDFAGGDAGDTSVTCNNFIGLTGLSQGNRLLTNLGGPLAYTNDHVAASTALGPQGRYFTRKLPGLFVFGAETDGVEWFEVAGTVYYGDAKQSSSFRIHHNGRWWSAFVVNHQDYWTTINHLVLVDQEGLQQTLGSGRSSQQQRITGLSGKRRIYHFLYLTTSKAVQPQAVFEELALRFLDRLPEFGSRMSFDPASGSTPPFGTGSSVASFDALGLDPGVYHGTVTAESTTGHAPASAPVTVTVNAPRLDTPGGLARLMFPGQVPMAVDLPFTSTLSEPQPWLATLESPAGWLTLENETGTTPQSLRLRLDPAGLSAGKHTAIVAVTSESATFHIPVTLQIQDLAIGKFVADPARPLVYAIHKNGLNEGALLVYDSITRRILHSIPTGKEPTDCDVSEDGSKVWVINSKDPSLMAVSTATWQVTETIPLTGSFSSRNRVGTEPGAHVKCGKGSIVYYVDEQWGPRLRVFDTATRSLLQTFSAESGTSPDTSNNYGYGDIGLDPGRTMLFGWRQYGDSAGVGGSHIVRFDIKADGTLGTFAKSASYNGAHFDRAPYDTPVLASDDGSRVLIKDREVDPEDLDAFPLVYPAPLYSIAGNGRIAASAAKIYSTADAREIASLPVTTAVQAILPDLSALVYFDAATKTAGWVDLVATLGGEALGLPVSPADNSVVTSPSRLEWPALTGISRYRVYLGTSEAEVSAATPGSARDLGETTDTWLDLATTPGIGRHFWRVVPLDANGQPIGNGMALSFNVANLAFSRTSIRAATIAGNPNLAETIGLSAPDSRNWSASANVPWIGFTSATGSTPGDLTVVIDASALAAGEYSGEVTVSCDGVTTGVPVYLSLHPANYTLAKADLERPLIYAVSEGTDPNQPAFLVVIDTASNAIERTVPVGSSVTGMSVHHADNRIYLTNWRSGLLRAIDRDSLEEVRVYPFNPPASGYGTGSGDAYVVAAGRAGRIVLEQQDQWINMFLVDTVTGAKISTAPGSIRQGGGVFEPAGRFYYHGESNSSGAALKKFDTDGDAFALLGSQRVSSFSYYGSRLVEISGDGSRIFWNGGVFDRDLNVLMQLNEEVVASTYRGELLFTNTKALNGSSSEVLANLPVETKVQAVSEDQRKLFLFKNAAFTVVDIATIAAVPPRGLVPGIADDAVVIGTSQELAWSQEAAALSYDVYFGTSASAVSAAGKDSPEFLGNVAGTTWTGALPDLALGGEYFWRIDLVGFSSATKGDVWSFQVAPVDVSPRRVELAVPSGSPVPRQTLEMKSATPLAWSASSTTPWITVIDSTGTTADTLRFDISTSGMPVGAQSGSITVQSGGVTFSVPVELSVVTLNVTQLVSHPERPVVYAINTALSGEGFSHLLELDTATAAIRRTLPIGFAPTDADLDAASNKLYVTNWGYSQTRVIDVEAWRELPSLNLGTDVYKIEATPDGRLITEEEDQWIRLDMWDAASGENLASSSNPYFHVREGDGKVDPTGNYYYRCENNSSGARWIKYDIRSNSFIEAAASPLVGFGSRNLILSEDGSRLFCRGRVMDKDLNLLGEMPGEIHATNRSGDLAVGPAAVWWSDSATEVVALPFSSTVAAFSTGDSHLLRFNAASRTLHSIPLSSLTDLPGPWPRPGQVLADSPERFSWTPVAGAASYRIFIAENAAALQAMSVPTATVATANYEPPTPLAIGRYFSWRVDVVTGSGAVTGTTHQFGIEYPAGPAVPQTGTGIAVSLADRHLLVGINGSARLYDFNPADGRASAIQNFSLPGFYTNHYFGSTVAMDAGKAAVGAYGENSSYLFRPGPAGYWERTGPLTPPEPVSSERFGRGLSASGNLMLAGTQGTTSAKGRVCAYITEPQATLTQTFSAEDGVANDGFGQVIAMEGNHAVIAAPGRGSSYNRLPCLYAFSRSTSTGLWTQTQKITIPGATSSSNAIRAIALSGNTLATASGNSAVVIFSRDRTGRWNESATINRSNVPNTSTSFGSGLALVGDQLFIGDPSASHKGTSGGAVFSFRRAGTSWLAGPVIAPDGSRSGFGAALAARDHWLVAAGGSSQTAWLFRVAATENRTPRFLPGLPTQVVAGRMFAVPVLAEDADGNSGLVIDKLQGPAWLGVTDNGNGQALLSGTPAGATGDIHTVQLRVRDTAGAETLHTYQLSLLAPTDLPVLDSPPLAADLGVGQELVLRASASGIGPFQWQWFKDGQAIDGATGTTHIISEAVQDNSGSYHVSVSNVVGTVESAAVEVSVRPADRYAGDWPTFGGSPAHTGRHPAALEETHFLPAWNAELQKGFALNRAAIANGRAVVVPQSRFATGISVKGLDLKTGATLWNFPVPSSNSTNPPSIHQGKVYFQRGKGTGGDTPQLFSLDAATGQQLWASTFGAQWESYEAPAVNDAGIFINGGYGGGIYGFSLNGSERFYQNLPQYDDWTPTLANGRLFSWVEGGFIEHNPYDGSMLWSLDSGWDWRGWSMNTVSAVAGNSAAMISTTDLICVDLPTRSIRWRVPASYRGSPGIADGRVFAIQGNAVRSYSLADGKPGLVYQTSVGTGYNEYLVDQPILFNDRLAISSETKTWIFNLEDGTLLQTLDAGGRLSYSEGYLLAAGNDGVLRAFIALNYNPKLASLELGTGGFLPEFDSLTTRYIATVPFDTDTVTITPTTEYPDATVAINGVPEANGSASAPIVLDVGENEIPILVTAEDGITTMTYTIAVTRLPQNFVFNSSTDIPLTANGFLTGGFPVNVILNHHPAPGTALTMVNNTGMGFIHGRFGNLAHGRRITLQYNGVDYDFVANYHGGTGNDLVLHWADNSAVAWGQNNQGQLGDGTTMNAESPVSVESPEDVLAGKTLFALSAGYLHSLALLHDGTVAAWGYNTQGQLGLGHQNHSHLPQQVRADGTLAGKTVIAIAAGAFHNLALCDDGTIVAWGLNTHGQLGSGDRGMRTAPVTVEPLGALAGKRVVAIAAGFYHSLALCDDGTVAAWGYNDEGELGDGTNAGALVPVAVDVSGALAGKSVVRISAGQYHSLAQCSDGTLAAWGYNARGQLGDGTTTDRQTPTLVDLTGIAAGGAVESISAGGSHSLALLADGTLAGWGGNARGQLITGGAPQFETPQPLSDVALDLHAGANHSVLRRSPQSIHAWGDTRAAWSTSDTDDDLASSPWVAVASGPSAFHNLGIVALPGQAAVPFVTFDEWRDLHFGSAELSARTEDAYRSDDHPNLLKYAFGLDPHQNAAGKIPRPRRVDDRLELRFTRPAGVADVSYGAEWSPDLSPGSWRDVPDSGSGDEYLFSLPVDTAPSLFMRLRVRSNMPQ